MVRATGGAIDKEVSFLLQVNGPTLLSRSLTVNATGSANTDQLSGLTRLSGVTDWRVDTRLHDFSGTTGRSARWSLWGSAQPYLDLDPSTATLRLISSTEGLDDARNCAVSYLGRSQLLVRVQRANSGQYSLQIWNSDGSGFAASLPANCLGAPGPQHLNQCLAIGGDLYGQPGRAAGFAYWRLLAGLGAGAADPPAALSGLLAYEFDQFTLAESGGSSPAGPTLNYSPGFSGPLSPATYVPTPAAAVQQRPIGDLRWRPLAGSRKLSKPRLSGQPHAMAAGDAHPQLHQRQRPEYGRVHHQYQPGTEPDPVLY